MEGVHSMNLIEEREDSLLWRGWRREDSNGSLFTIQCAKKI